MLPFIAVALAFPLLPQAPAEPTRAAPPPLSTSLPSSFWWGDHDGDGRLDALVVPPGGAAVLLRNLGDGSFADVSRRAGLQGLIGVRQASWRDFDADGRLDLLVALSPGAGRLLLNSAEGRFRDVSAASGLPLEEGLIHAEPCDYDADGLPDVVLATAAGERLFHNLGSGRFEAAPGAIEGALPAREVERAGAQAATGAGAALAGATQVGPTASAAGSSYCLDLIRDLVSGNCTYVSSMPTLGTLYPLGPELSIDGAGRVGIGTISPGAQLDVVGDVRASGRLVSTLASGAPLIVSSTTVVPNLNADRLDGLHASAFSQLGGSIGTSELEDAAVTAPKIAAAAVVGSHIAPSAVTSAAIADGTLVDADVSNSAAIKGKKVISVFGDQVVTGSGGALFTTSGSTALTARGLDGPNNGYAGVEGTSDFDGVTTADWSGFEIGLAGISTAPPSYDADNYGVLGHANYVGVHGEYSGDPYQVYGELGMQLLGYTYGVIGFGHTTGVFGEGDEVGVYARNLTNVVCTAELGTDTYGVVADSDLAAGKFGYTNSSSSATFDGVRGITGHTSGYGVMGQNLATTGATSWARGVMGIASSTLGYGVYSNGNLGCSGTKSFVNPHPTDPLEEIRFVCLEGNESGTYFRGSTRLVGGRARIEVPEEFRLVTSKERPLTVQVTPIGAPAVVWVESKDLERIVVRGNVDVELDYFVNGVRRGFEEVTLIAPNSSFLPERMDEPFGAQYPDSLRRILVENGTLNPDFTPNAATQALLESQLEGYRVRMQKLRMEMAALERHAATMKAAEAALGER